jgi:hypothetical protein
MVPPLLVGGSSTKGRRPIRGLTMALAIPGKTALQNSSLHFGGADKNLDYFWEEVVCVFV